MTVDLMSAYLETLSLSKRFRNLLIASWTTSMRKSSVPGFKSPNEISLRSGSSRSRSQSKPISTRATPRTRKITKITSFSKRALRRKVTIENCVSTNYFQNEKIFESAKNEPPPRGRDAERAKFRKQESQESLARKSTHEDSSANYRPVVNLSVIFLSQSIIFRSAKIKKMAPSPDIDCEGIKVR